MNLRKLLGLCEHKFNEEEYGLIRAYKYGYESQQPMVVVYCEKCGDIKIKKSI